MSSSEITSSNDLLVCANHVCEVTFKNSSFCLHTLKKRDHHGQFLFLIEWNYKFCPEATSANDLLVGRNVCDVL